MKINGFHIVHKTEPDTTGEGDLWLFCPDGTHFAIAYSTGDSFQVYASDEPWFYNVVFEHPINDERANLSALAEHFKPLWEAGMSRKGP